MTSEPKTLADCFRLGILPDYFMAFNIDWSQFGDNVTTTCYCRCGGIYRSHAKTVKHHGSWKGCSQLPCPKCGKHDDLFRVSQDPESVTL